VKILALDMATKTGWALKEGNQIISGVQDFSKQRGESPGMIFLKFRAWLKNFKRDRLLVVIEQTHHRGGAATDLCAGLKAEAQAFAAENGFEITPVHSATLKKWTCGHGKADKDAMIKKARELGFNPKDDNEADAIHLLRYAIKELGL
jgi:Holliday junction resolvasome RuvABC endonuclease subunit